MLFLSIFSVVLVLLVSFSSLIVVNGKSWLIAALQQRPHDVKQPA